MENNVRGENTSYNWRYIYIYIYAQSNKFNLLSKNALKMS